ncbi:pentatricopeptide repeat-containing protein At5g15010, mitochondrial [Diospyros lotus]|uniref:pentatricopeptide repeat-containing protein At5g15010, mitochondrial n=1 Tax=Diospyros lotus TaxID=55363 RepID=UPI00224DF0B0|nr:pentatricopeptide repeat-containing protein At5g15010, mitochondrial [Diospyros lotus]
MMWGGFRRRFTKTILSVKLRAADVNPKSVNPIQFQFQCANSIAALNLTPCSATGIVTSPLRSPLFAISLSSFSSLINENQIAASFKSYDQSEVDDNTEASEDDCSDDGLDVKFGQDIAIVLKILQEPGRRIFKVRNRLEQCSITASYELVVEVLSRVRNDWEAAFTFFLWAAKQPDYAHSLRAYHSMISILAKMRKFDTAWSLINEMRRTRSGESLVTPQTLLIMIRRYCAAHEIGKAISTFYAHKLFKFDMGMEEFHSLLSALCRYKNVKDAEHMLFCNENSFPFNTKSFNIILNGWCNILGNPREAKRIWREMDERGIVRDAISYSSILSCFSKANKLNEVLKLFNQMKALDIAPDRKVYNAVIHALAKGRLVKDAHNLLITMEENGIAPNAVTYNSLIKPICRAHQLDEAREVFSEMLQRGLSPTVRTYHAFFRILRSAQEVFALLQNMKKMGCCPNNDTYIMLIRKFCRWRQLDNVHRLWGEMSQMSQNGGPDRSSYIALIYGLFLNGELEEAHKYYKEMKAKQYLPEPKLDEMLQSWALGKQITNRQMIDSRDNQLELSHLDNKSRVTSTKFDKQSVSY